MTTPNHPSPPLDDRGLPVGYALREGWEVSPREVEAMRERGVDFVLLDCRLPREHAAASIDGSVLLPMQELPARLADLEPHKEAKVVVHCHHGMRSLRVTQFLREQGFRDVTSMAGGIDLWSVAVDPKVPRY